MIGKLFKGAADSVKFADILLFFPEVKGSYNSRIDLRCGSYKYCKEEMITKIEAFINAYRN